MKNTIEIIVRVNGKDMCTTGVTSRVEGLLEVAEEKYGFKFERTDEALADMCSTAYTSDKALDAAEMDSIGVNSGTFVEALYCQDVLHFFNDKHGIKSEFIVLVNADTYVSTDIKKALLTDVYNTRCLVVSSGDEGQSATLVTETGYVLVCDKSRAEDWDIIGIRQCDASDLVHRDVKFETALAMIEHYAANVQVLEFTDM